MTPVVYICGPNASGKTMLALALADYYKNRLHIYPRVKIIDECIREIKPEVVQGSAMSGDWDIILVDWPADQPETFPVTPFRVIRTDRK